MSALEKLLPRQASNDYRGHPVALYAFVLLAVVMCGRSLVHFLKADSGVNSIATIITFSGDPDPNRVVYMYSALWGTQQLITVLVYGAVLYRYRNLVPLMWALMIVELVLRSVVGTLLHPLTPEFYASTPPGKLMGLPLMLASIAMLTLSLRVTRSAGSSPRAAPA